jgi:hypothetical protein
MIVRAASAFSTRVPRKTVAPAPRPGNIPFATSYEVAMYLGPPDTTLNADFPFEGNSDTERGEKLEDIIPPSPRG